jgi:hypothetical protein
VRTAIAAVSAAVLAAAAVAGQDLFPFRRGGDPRPRYPSADSFDGRFNFCRLMYTRVTREAGGQGWWTDYPAADVNFSIRLSELTKARVSRNLSGEPNHVVVRATDNELFQCPFVIISDPGTVGFADDEVARLREYLLKGGFLWADDFWGTRAWEQWESEIGRILPPLEFPIINLTAEHPLFRTMFELKEIPQIPNIGHWRRSGGGTSERGYDSEWVNIRGISDERSRLLVLMTHNTDIQDAWEREGEDPQFFYRFSPNGYAVGINVYLYAMTH